MAGVLTVGTLLIIALLGVWGVWRGVLRGLLTLGGTLLGAVFISLWGEALSAWVRAQFPAEDPAEPVWLALSLTFLVVALVIGYGSGLLLPRHRLSPLAGVGEQLAGGLVGALNGALIASYLLRYAAETQPGNLAGVVQSTLPLRVLYDWLPWFVLAIVMLIGAWVLLNVALWLVEMSRHAASRNAAAPRPQAARTHRNTPAPAPPDHLENISTKIDQALKDSSRK